MKTPSKKSQIIVGGICLIAIVLLIHDAAKSRTSDLNCLEKLAIKECERWKGDFDILYSSGWGEWDRYYCHQEKGRVNHYFTEEHMDFCEV